MVSVGSVVNAMLAYLFSHARRPDVSPDDYERKLRAFHEALRAHAPAGFIDSRVFRLAALPWLPSAREVYEDWYLIENSAALDPLNDAAVSGPRQAPHDAVAVQAESGHGALYRLRLGRQDGIPAFAYWFAKPAGEPYATLYARLEPIVARGGAALWSRQMTMGPAREFCLHSPARLDLPADLEALELRLDYVFGRGERSL